MVHVGQLFLNLFNHLEIVVYVKLKNLKEYSFSILVYYQGWYITLIKRDETERRKKERELELAKSSLDTQERTIQHFEQERKKMEQKLDSSKL